nr:PREDICTED: disrupted in schizophrenia 1 protein-like [Phalacrocorax carbo]
MKEALIAIMRPLDVRPIRRSCGSQLLQRVWEADLEACQLLIRGFQLKETSCCVFEEEENQLDEMEMTADGPSDSEKRKGGHFPKGTEWGTVPCPKRTELKEVMEDISFGAEGHLSEEFFMFSAALGEKCEAISEKLAHLEDQLQTSACRADEGVMQSLQREIQVVKETLQTVLVQLQPAREAGEEKAGDFLCDSWCPGKQDLKE